MKKLDIEIAQHNNVRRNSTNVVLLQQDEYKNGLDVISGSYSNLTGSKTQIHFSKE